MRAMVLPRFGGPELFEPRDVPAPTPGPGQVLVRVIASGTNPVDAKLRQNGSWAGIQPPAVIGYDASGVIEQVGPGVTDFKPGAKEDPRIPSPSLSTSKRCAITSA